MGRRLLASALLMLIISSITWARKPGVLNGFDGGMMLHTGFIHGNIQQLDHQASGMPFGIGGVIKLHLGEHWRIGSEGYVSTLQQLDNGSYVKYGWGGLLGDFYWRLGSFMPYAGLTIGGGANTNLLIKGEAVPAWEPVEDTYFNKQSFLAVAPFAGCDYVLSESFHLTVKVDMVNCINGNYRIPTGPRLYFGFIFYH